ncbi:MAG: hypothetical protein WC943_07100 [Elusimicrobiota bacterium]
MPRPDPSARLLAEVDARAFLDPAALADGVVRALSSRPFDDDPVRILDSFRVASELGFQMDPGTLDLFRGRRGLLAGPAPSKRTRDAFLELLAGRHSPSVLALMDECRVLTTVVPELEPGRRCAVEYYGQGGVMAHTLAALDRAGFLLESLPRAFPGLEGRIRETLDSSRRQRSLFIMTVLLHDIAKPATARRMKGRLRFFGHDAKGAAAAAVVMKRFKFAKPEIALAAGVIRLHLRPGNLAASGRVTDRAARRFFRDAGEAAGALLLAAWADHASYLSEDKLRERLPLIGTWARAGGDCETAFPAPAGMDEDTSKTLRHLWTVSVLLVRHFRRPTPALKRLVDGDDVMKALGLAPGKEVGRVLAKLANAQAKGRFTDRAGALSFLTRLSSK